MPPPRPGTTRSSPARAPALLGLFVALTAAPARADMPVAAADQGRHVVQVLGETFCLPRSHIDPVSVAVWMGDMRLLPGRDFMLDAASGCFRFPNPETFLGAELVIEYRHFPFPLAARYAHREPGAAVPVATTDTEPDSAAMTIVPRRLSGGPGGFADGGNGTGEGTASGGAVSTLGSASGGKSAGRLAVRGNKSFAVRFGSAQDASLSQSLDLEVDGQVATGVELKAILSDRDLPLAPAGNTETIDEIDKVMLEVKSRHLAATLGDYDVQAYGGNFLQYAKRLEGVKAQGQATGREFMLAAAVAKGRFLSLELLGTEGKQGPYALTDEAGNPDITIIAGSETVWINGERLARGEHNDYTIDYGRAEVTFTPGRPIRADSRITVDYEYASAAYERNFYVGGGKADLGSGKLALGLSVVSEADDSGDPLGGLSDRERDILASAGDSARTTARDAGVFVGPGQGEYLALGQDLVVRYQYAGVGRGDYEVGFLEVGQGAGDYSDSLTATGRRVYRYVGQGQGSFVPGRVLAPPLAHRLVDLTGKSNLRDDLTIEGELALSGLDRNTLSGLDDLDNSGRAHEYRVRYHPELKLGSQAVGIALKGGYRDVGQEFRTIGRIRNADYDYQWNAPPGAFDRGEERRDLGFEVTPFAGLELRTDLAGTRTDVFNGRSQAYGLAFDRRVSARFRMERTAGEAHPVPGFESEALTKGSEDRSRAFESGELATTIGRVRPRVTFERDERIEQATARRTGSVYMALGGGADIELPARARFGIDVRRRNDEALGTGRPWTEIRRSLEQTYRLELPRAGAVSMTGSFTRRVADEIPTDTRQVADLVQVDLLHSSLGGGFESDTHYDVTTTDVAREGQELVYVGGGQGAYDAFGRYVGTGGDYTLRRTEDSRASDLRTQLRLGTRWQLEPRRFLGPPAENHGFERVASALGFETTLDLEELTRLPIASPRLFFDPASYQRDDATFRGVALFRQDVEVLEGNRYASFRLRAERRDEADNRVAGVERDLGTRAQGIRVRSTPWSPLAAELEWSWGATTSDEEVVRGGGGKGDGDGGARGLADELPGREPGDDPRSHRPPGRRSPPGVPGPAGHGSRAGARRRVAHVRGEPEPHHAHPPRASRLPLPALERVAGRLLPGELPGGLPPRITRRVRREPRVPGWGPRDDLGWRRGPAAAGPRVHPYRAHGSAGVLLMRAPVDMQREWRGARMTFAAGVGAMVALALGLIFGGSVGAEEITDPFTAEPFMVDPFMVDSLTAPAITTDSLIATPPATGSPSIDPLIPAVPDSLIAGRGFRSGLGLRGRTRPLADGARPGSGAHPRPPAPAERPRSRARRDNGRLSRSGLLARRGALGGDPARGRRRAHRGRDRGRSAGRPRPCRGGGERALRRRRHLPAPCARDREAVLACRLRIGGRGPPRSLRERGPAVRRGRAPRRELGRAGELHPRGARGAAGVGRRDPGGREQGHQARGDRAPVRAPRGSALRAARSRARRRPARALGTLRRRRAARARAGRRPHAERGPDPGTRGPVQSGERRGGLRRPGHRVDRALRSHARELDGQRPAGACALGGARAGRRALRARLRRAVDPRLTGHRPFRSRAHHPGHALHPVAGGDHGRRWRSFPSSRSRPVGSGNRRCNRRARSPGRRAMRWSSAPPGTHAT